MATAIWWLCRWGCEMPLQTLTRDNLREAHERLESAYLALESLMELLLQSSEHATIKPFSLYQLIKPAVSDAQEAFACIRDRTLP